MKSLTKFSGRIWKSTAVNLAQFCTAVLVAARGRSYGRQELRCRKEPSIQTIVRDCLPGENYWFDSSSLRSTSEKGSNFGLKLWAERRLMVVNFNPEDIKYISVQQVIGRLTVFL